VSDFCITVSLRSCLCIHFRVAPTSLGATVLIVNPGVALVALKS
jgi:hypothetical protein